MCINARVFCIEFSGFCRSRHRLFDECIQEILQLSHAFPCVSPHSEALNCCWVMNTTKKKTASNERSFCSPTKLKRCWSKWDLNLWLTHSCCMPERFSRVTRVCQGTNDVKLFRNHKTLVHFQVSAVISGSSELVTQIRILRSSIREIGETRKLWHETNRLKTSLTFSCWRWKITESAQDCVTFNRSLWLKAIQNSLHKNAPTDDFYLLIPPELHLEFKL